MGIVRSAQMVGAAGVAHPVMSAAGNHAGGVFGLVLLGVVEAAKLQARA